MRKNALKKETVDKENTKNGDNVKNVAPPTKRPALVDKTNSGSDINSSISSVKSDEKTNPKKIASRKNVIKIDQPVNENLAKKGRKGSFLEQAPSADSKPSKLSIQNVENSRPKRNITRKKFADEQKLPIDKDLPTGGTADLKMSKNSDVNSSKLSIQTIENSKPKRNIAKRKNADQENTNIINKINEISEGSLTSTPIYKNLKRRRGAVTEETTSNLNSSISPIKNVEQSKPKRNVTKRKIVDQENVCPQKKTFTEKVTSTSDTNSSQIAASLRPKRRINPPKRYANKENILDTPKTNQRNILVDIINASSPQISPKKNINQDDFIALKTPETKILGSKIKTVNNLNTTRTPIYKNKLIKHNDSELNVSNKLALYDFELDSDSEPKPTAVKKKTKKVKAKSTVKRAKPVKKQKMLSDSLSKAAMAMLLKDIEKIRAIKLLRKLRLKKKLKDAEDALLAAENQKSIDGDAQNDDIHEDDFAHEADDHIFDGNSSGRGSPEFFEEPCIETPQIMVTSTPTANPIINRSVNTSTKKSIGSPWRMEVKTVNNSWNFSVKPSMTPAYERDSFHIIGLDDKNVQHKNVPKENNNIVKKPTRFTQKDILSLFKMKRSPKKIIVTPPIEEPTIISPQEFNINADSESSNENTSQVSNPEKQVALFEDPEEIPTVHYNKPTRKIYERSKKLPVRFKEAATVAVEKEHSGNTESENDEEYVVTAKTVKKKKKKTKTQKPAVSKKEVKQLNEWAAEYNSMLEEAEDFDLNVE